MSQIEEIENHISVSFKNKDLLTQALMHRSFVVENRLGDLASNERLEFLGDAVLELVITDYLYQSFPDKPEGILTQLRSVIVNTKTLAQSLRKLNFGEYIFLSRGEKISGGAEKERILANILEAIIGALYLDQGYEKAKEFIERAILSNASKLVASSSEYNPKGILQEAIQASKRVTPEYKILEESGPDHSKVFVAGAFLEGKKIGEGRGVSKKEAEEEAARDALNHVKK